MAAANEVRIEVTAETAKAEGGFKDVRAETDKLDKSTKTLGGSFGNLTKGLALIGVGGLSTGIIMQQMVQAGTELRHSLASSAFSLISFGEVGQQAFGRMAPHFRDIAFETGATQSEVSRAFSILVNQSGSTDVSVERLTQTMKLAKVAGVGFEEAAVAVGKAMFGDIDAINLLVRGTADAASGMVTLEEALLQVEKRFPESRTQIEEWWGSVKIGLEELGSGLDDFLRMLDMLPEISKLTFDFILKPAGAEIMDTLKDWDKDVKKFVFDFAMNVAGDFNSFYSRLIGWVANAPSYIVGFAMDVAGDFESFVSRLIGWITTPLSYIVGFAMDVAGDFESFVSRLIGWITTPLSYIVGFAMDVAGDFESFYNRLIGWLAEAPGVAIKFGAALSDIASDIYDWIKGAIAGITLKFFASFTDDSRKVYNWITGVWAGITLKFLASFTVKSQKVYDWITDGAEAVITFVAQGLIDIGKAIGQAIKDFILGWINPIGPSFASTPGTLPLAMAGGGSLVVNNYITVEAGAGDEMLANDIARQVEQTIENRLRGAGRTL